MAWLSFSDESTLEVSVTQYVLHKSTSYLLYWESRFACKWPLKWCRIYVTGWLSCEGECNGGRRSFSDAHFRVTACHRLLSVKHWDQTMSVVCNWDSEFLSVINRLVITILFGYLFWNCLIVYLWSRTFWLIKLYRLVVFAHVTILYSSAYWLLAEQCNQITGCVSGHWSIRSCFRERFRACLSCDSLRVVSYNVSCLSLMTWSTFV